MAPIPLKRSLADMQNTDACLPEEFNDADFVKEVLLLEGTTEKAVDEAVFREATSLGIDSSSAHLSTQNGQCPPRESKDTILSGRVRSGSTGSEASASTGMTSRSSNEHYTTGALSILRTRSFGKRSVSFSEYDKYLAQSAAQEEISRSGLSPPIHARPTPSIFSVTSRTSYVSIKSSLKRRLKFRRSKVSSTGLK